MVNKLGDCFRGTLSEYFPSSV